MKNWKGTKHLITDLELVHKVKNVNYVEFGVNGDSEKGQLVAIENKALPFKIQRVYTVAGVKESVERGFHAHKNTEQIFFALNGSIDVYCEDLYGSKEVYTLDKQNQGLFCGKQVWHSLVYHDNAILMVLASEEYNETDYIRNYDEFKRDM